jgi:hypothetical protein
VIVYWTPWEPVNVHPVIFTTPDTAVRLEHPEIVPVDESVIVRVELVTTLPPWSSILITGSVVRVVPEAPATGWVVKTSLYEEPVVVGEKDVDVAEKFPLEAVIVYDVPTVPPNTQLTTFTIPEDGVSPEQSESLPAEEERVIGAVALVTILPWASCTSITG